MATGSVTAAVNLADAAVSVLVTGWVSTVAVTGSVPKSSASFKPGIDGANPHGFTLPFDVQSLRLQLDGQNSGGNDIDLYLYYDGVVPSRRIDNGSGTSNNPDELITAGRLPAGHYTAWVHGFNAVPATGTPYTLTLTGSTITGSPVTGYATPASVRRVATDLNGNVIETDVLGSPFVPSNGRIATWDSVAPLNTAVFYRVRETVVFDSSPTVTPLASNTVTVTGQGDGWLKDPAQPVNDVHLVPGCVGSTAQLDCVGTGGITFQEVDNDSSFRNASGVYDVINAARARVVAQLRGARESVLQLLAHRLADALKIETILRSGRVLCLQLDPQYGWAYDTWNSDFIQVGDARAVRVSGTAMPMVERVWSLPFRLTNPPPVIVNRVQGSAIGVRNATYSAATASGRTYAQRTATGNTYGDTTLGRGLM